MQLKFYDLIKSLHITEKSNALNEAGDVSLVVRKDATKTSLKKLFKYLFNIDVSSVRILNYGKKKKSFKGKIGYTSSYKKAIISIGKGKKIDFSKVF